MEKKKLELKTPIGTLVAEITGDSDYPNIAITMEDDEGCKDVALVEINKGDNIVRTLAWKEDEEDYTSETYFNMPNGNK